MTFVSQKRFHREPTVLFYTYSEKIYSEGGICLEEFVNLTLKKKKKKKPNLKENACREALLSETFKKTEGEEDEIQFSVNVNNGKCQVITAKDFNEEEIFQRF